MNTEEKTKLYTKHDLENIVEQRLSRERKNNESLFKMRSVLSSLREKEPFKMLSNAAVAEKLCELADATEGGEKAEDTAVLSEVPDTTQENTAHICMKEQDATAEQNAEQYGDAAFACPEKNGVSPDDHVENDEKLRRMREISEFLTAYSEDTLVSAMTDDAFKAFCRGKKGNILELYENYKAFLEALENSREARNYRAARASLASTAFSGNASSAVDYGSMLTESQKELASRAGMSYRRYAELLAQIPSKKLINK